MAAVGEIDRFDLFENDLIRQRYGNEGSSGWTLEFVDLFRKFCLLENSHHPRSLHCFHVLEIYYLISITKKESEKSHLVVHRTLYIQFDSETLCFIHRSILELYDSPRESLLCSQDQVGVFQAASISLRNASI